MFKHASSRVIRQGRPSYRLLHSLVQPISSFQYYQGGFVARAQDMVQLLDPTLLLLKEVQRTNVCAIHSSAGLIIADQQGLYFDDMALELSSRACFLQSDEYEVAVLGLEGYEIRIMDLETRSWLKTYTTEDYNNTMDWSNSLVVSGGEFLSFWDINRGLLNKMYNLSDEEIIKVNIRVSPGQQNFIFSLSAAGVLGLVDPRTNRTAGRPKLFSSAPQPFLQTNQSGFLILHSKTEIKVFDLVAFKVRMKVQADAIAGVALVNNLFLVLLHEGRLQLYDIDSCQKVWQTQVGSTGHGVWCQAGRIVLGVDNSYGVIQFQ